MSDVSSHNLFIFFSYSKKMIRFLLRISIYVLAWASIEKEELVRKSNKRQYYLSRRWIEKGRSREGERRRRKIPLLLLVLFSDVNTVLSLSPSLLSHSSSSSSAFTSFLSLIRHTLDVSIGFLYSY